MGNNRRRINPLFRRLIALRDTPDTLLPSPCPHPLIFLQAGVHPAGIGGCNLRTRRLVQPSLAGGHSLEPAGTTLHVHLLLGRLSIHSTLSFPAVTCLKPALKGPALGVSSVECDFPGDSESRSVDRLSFISLSLDLLSSPHCFIFSCCCACPLCGWLVCPGACCYP